MNKTKTKFAIGGCLIYILHLIVTLPIWYYLLYHILKCVEATQLMWFLYWVYVPVGFVLAILTSGVKYLMESVDKNEQ